MPSRFDYILKPGKLVAINGYRGDRLTRTILIDRVYDNRVCGLDAQRNEFRSYLFREIDNVSEVKQDA